MKIQNIKAPIIIDDIFTASDFDNSIRIDTFFETLFDVFSSVTHRDRSELQLIFFTHDEIVLNSITDVYKNNKNANLKYISGRLYPVEQLDIRDLAYGKTFYNLFQRFT